MASPRFEMATSTAVSTPAAVDPACQQSLLKRCWSCRVLGGGGLLLAGGYVYLMARRVMRQGGPVSLGTVTAITFSACLCSAGVTVLVDPVGRLIPKD